DHRTTKPTPGADAGAPAPVPTTRNPAVPGLRNTGTQNPHLTPVSTVNYWRTAKKGPHYVKVGRHVRYLPESVDKYVLELMATQEGENNDR
ncbi:hypothetical protein ACL1CU_13720, partial [Corynebacterium striatum]